MNADRLWLCWSAAQCASHIESESEAEGVPQRPALVMKGNLGEAVAPRVLCSNGRVPQCFGVGVLSNFPICAGLHADGVDAAPVGGAGVANQAADRLSKGSRCRCRENPARGKGGWTSFGYAGRELTCSRAASRNRSKSKKNEPARCVRKCGHTIRKGRSRGHCQRSRNERLLNGCARRESDCKRPEKLPLLAFLFRK